MYLGRLSGDPKRKLQCTMCSKWHLESETLIVYTVAADLLKNMNPNVWESDQNLWFAVLVEFHISLRQYLHSHRSLLTFFDKCPRVVKSSENCQLDSSDRRVGPSPFQLRSRFTCTP